MKFWYTFHEVILIDFSGFSSDLNIWTSDCFSELPHASFYGSAHFESIFSHSHMSHLRFMHLKELYELPFDYFMADKLF